MLGSIKTVLIEKLKVHEIIAKEIEKHREALQPEIESMVKDIANEIKDRAFEQIKESFKKSS